MNKSSKALQSLTSKVDRLLISCKPAGTRNSKKSKKSKRQKRSSRAQRPQRGGGGVTDLARAIADPWSGNACVPDGSRFKDCFTFKNTAQLQSGTGTAASFCFQLNPNGLFWTDTSSTGGGYNIPAASFWQPAVGVSAATNQFSRWRPVGGGVKITYVGNQMTETGTMIVAIMPPGSIPSGLHGTNYLNVVGLCTEYKIYNLARDVKVTWRPEDSQDFNFVNFGNSPSLGTAAERPWLFIGFNNLATAGAGVINMDYIAHFEGFNQNSGVQIGSTGLPEHPAVPGWYELAQNIISKIPPISLSQALTAASLVGQIANVPMSRQLLLMR